MSTATATVDYVDVANLWRTVVDGTSNPLSARQGPAIGEMRGMWKSNPGFTGMTEAEMRTAVDDGYSVPGDTIRGRNTRARRKLRFNEEEGEIQFDRIYSGDDDIYLDFKPRKRQRGIKLEIELAVLASTPPWVLSDYAVWIGKLVNGLEGGGYQMQIDVVSRCRGLTSSVAQNDTKIRVKQFGTRGSLRSWSAILSPGGFRHLVFAARILGCESLKMACKGSMGGSFGPKYGLDWDPRDRKLTIKCAANADHFPAEQMDRELAAIKF